MNRFENLLPAVLKSSLNRAFLGEVGRTGHLLKIDFGSNLVRGLRLDTVDVLIKLVDVLANIVEIELRGALLTLVLKHKVVNELLTSMEGGALIADLLLGQSYLLG